MKKEFETAVDIAGEIIENGGEISRAEETIERICIYPPQTNPMNGGYEYAPVHE